MTMQRVTSLWRITCFAGVLLLSVLSSQASVSHAADNSSKEERLAWFREAKYGMFIHWGPYAHLGGEWNGKMVEVGEQAEWIMKNMRIPVDEYREIAREFNPVRFDAREWVKVAQAAGMKYIVITAKHHDGFALYHSQVSPYNIVDWTPFKRDPLKELAEACAEEGIRFCFYYSHREDWDHPGAYGNGWDYDNDWDDSYYDPDIFENYLEEKAKPQMRELLTNYGPIGLVWFDRGIYTLQQGEEFIRIVRELQPACLINSRVGSYLQESIGDYQSMNDNGMPIGGVEEYWEAPQTLNRTWGYSKFDTEWKSPETVIRRLVEIASCGGNLLLNVGPTGLGDIPAASVDVLKQAGEWIHRNAESIYGTTASPFPPLPFGYCTVKDNKLYLHIRDWPDNGILTVPGLRNRITSAYLLRDPARKRAIKRKVNEAYITLPAKPLDSPITVLVLEIEGPPDVYPPIVQQEGDSSIELSYITALTGGKSVKRFNVVARYHISQLTGPDDTVNWHFIVNAPGTYTAAITYAATQDWEGNKYSISAGSESLESSVHYTGERYRYKTFTVGTLTLGEAGEHVLTIRPSERSEQNLMCLRSLTLEPVSESGDR